MKRITLLDEINTLQDVPEIEKLRLKMELEKMRLEQSKVRRTVLAVVATLLSAVGTFYFNLTLQDRRARADFQIKAAEIVMTADSPSSAANKAMVLADLFPDWLPESFRGTFEKYGSQ